MKITPLDIQQKRFSRAMRGYDREEVEAFLSLAASAFEDLVKELHSLREDLTRRDEEIAAHRDLERTLQQTLVTAQRASEEMQRRTSQSPLSFHDCGDGDQESQSL